MAEPVKPPVPPSAPVKVPEPVKKPEVKKEDPEPELLEKIQAILKSNGGLESNIPINSEYWQVKGQYEAVRRAKGL